MVWNSILHCRREPRLVAKDVVVNKSGKFFIDPADVYSSCLIFLHSPVAMSILKLNNVGPHKVVT